MDIPTRSTATRPRGSGPSSAPARLRDPLAVLGVLTGRDRQLLALLGEHQVLTTSQLTRLAFPSRAMAQRRLLRLYQLGVLDRFRWYQTVGSQDWHYTTGLLGAELLAAARAATPPRPSEQHRRISRLAASPRLAHLLGINEVFSGLAGHARTHPGAALDAWWPERRCAEHYSTLVRPDGYGQWTQAGRRVEFFLEYDTGTEPLTRVVAKLAGYADLAAAGGPAIPVLFWVPTISREANLHAALARANSPVTVATANTELAAGYGYGPAGAIWHTRRSPERQPLIDVGTGRPSPPSADEWPPPAGGW